MCRTIPNRVSYGSEAQSRRVPIILASYQSYTNTTSVTPPNQRTYLPLP